MSFESDRQTAYRQTQDSSGLREGCNAEQGKPDVTSEVVRR